MPLFPSKEEPNTRNVLVWPPGTHSEENDITVRRRTRHRDRISREESIFYQKLDLLLFALGGSALWCAGVYAVLKWQKFPVHLHILEVSLIYALPVLLIVVLLLILERITNRGEAFVKKTD